MGRGFHALNNDGTPMSPAPAGSYFVSANPWQPALWIVYLAKEASPDRLQLVTVDDGDILPGAGGGLPYLTVGSDRKMAPVTRADWTGDWEYTDGTTVPPDDRPYSRLCVQVSAVTVVDEIATLGEVAVLNRSFGRAGLSATRAVLEPYGWGDFEPARV